VRADECTVVTLIAVDDIVLEQLAQVATAHPQPTR
jgi:hypothetical protein